MTEKKKKILLTLLITIAFLFITFIICMKSPLNPFSINAETATDSSVFKYIGWRMINGEVPYRDIFDHKGIVLYFINYLGALISIHRGVWVIEYIFMFISLGLTYKIFRKFCGKASSLIGTLLTFSPLYTYFEGGNLTEEYALPFIILGLYIFIDFFTNTKKYLSSNNRKNFINFNVILCGVSFACTFLLRQNMIALWIMFCIAVLFYCLNKKIYKEIFKFITSFLIGVAIVIIPVIIYLVINDAFNDFIKDYFLFNFTYSSNAENATLYNKISSFFIFLNTSSSILAFIIIIMKMIYNSNKKQTSFFEIYYIGFMIVNLIFISMAGTQYPHYGILTIPMLIYPYCILFKSLESDKVKKISPYITGYILFIMLLPTWLNFARDAFLGMSKTQIMNELNDYSKNYLIQYIKNNTYENEEIAIYGNKNVIYNFTKTKSASKYSYLTSTLVSDDEITQEYFLELEEKRPRFILWVKGEGFDSNKMQDFLDTNEYSKCNEYDNIYAYCLGVEL